MLSEYFLAHHGIKGQQWGVRNGPPYPVNWSDHSVRVKKGTKFHRISLNQEAAAAGHAYVNYLKTDAHRYKGFFGARLKKMSNNSTVYSIEMESKHDMVAPSKTTRVDTFLKLYNDDPVFRQKLGSYHKNDWHDFTPLPKAFYEKQYSKLTVDKQKTKGYETFVRAVGDMDPYIRDKYFSELAKKGYSFVTDDMDAGKFGKAPSIIFDREKSTKISNVAELDSKTINKIWRAEGTYITDSTKPKRSAFSKQRKMVNDIVDDLTSSDTTVGKISRNTRYNADFIRSTIRNSIVEKRTYE